MLLADVCRLTVLRDARSCLCRASTNASPSNRTLTFVDLTATGVADSYKQCLLKIFKMFSEQLFSYIHNSVMSDVDGH